MWRKKRPPPGPPGWRRPSAIWQASKTGLSADIERPSESRRLLYNFRVALETVYPDISYNNKNSSVNNRLLPGGRATTSSSKTHLLQRDDPIIYGVKSENQFGLAHTHTHKVYNNNYKLQHSQMTLVFTPWLLKNKLYTQRRGIYNGLYNSGHAIIIE